MLETRNLRPISTDERLKRALIARASLTRVAERLTCGWQQARRFWHFFLSETAADPTFEPRFVSRHNQANSFNLLWRQIFANRIKKKKGGGVLLTQHVNRSKVSWTPRLPWVLLSVSTPAAPGASHGEARSIGASIPATSARLQTQTKYSLFPPVKKATLSNAGVGVGVEKPPLRTSGWGELPPRPRLCRYQLGGLRRLLIRTRARTGAAFLKGPSTPKDGADMWRSGNAPSLAPPCGQPPH